MYVVLIIHNFTVNLTSLLKSTLQLFVFVADDLEFVVELGHLVGREAEVLLSVAHFLIETSVLGSEFLDLLAVGF